MFPLEADRSPPHSLRLVTYLHAEELMEEEHFLFWIVLNVMESDVDTLPIWLMVVKVFRRELTTARQLGARLASALGKHIQKVCLSNAS